ncbi:uncharacterized protein LOC123542491 [Mercenaria mercenaria]|uniref:uncharacterized protein LOC123542491 n=1 Tax=Mercenaria mercenaria TaxID=6596 RepID=UPI00234EA625|nr:uncharacterized protein LOC123542491 [Mercenaria mercenaria]
MQPSILFIKISVTLAVVYGVPINPMKRSAGLDAEDLTNSLSKLKSLLEKLETAGITKTNLADNIEESAKQTTDHGKEKSDKSDGDTDETLLNSVGKESGSQERIINMKKFVETLTPKELQKLKTLKELVQDTKNTRKEDKIIEGSFADTAVHDSKERPDVTNWKELAKRLENERDDLYLQYLKEEDKPVHIETETKEGTFGEFRDEIKYAVEKNLLTDVALAIHSGIDVDEILADLSAQGNERSYGAIWTKRNRD